MEDTPDTLEEAMAQEGPEPEPGPNPDDIQTVEPEDLEAVSQLGLVNLSSVKGKKFEWLWKDRVPQRGCTVFAGKGEVGKTLLNIDIATRVSLGKDFPDGSPCERGRVLFFSAEDDAETVLQPRFEALGADMDRITIQGTEAPILLNLGDKNGVGLDLLEKTLRCFHGQVRFIAFDPFSAYILGRDINRDDEVRAVLQPLTRLCRKYRVAVANTMHFGKDTEVKAKYRTLGSVGIVNNSRAAWAVGREYEEDDLIHFLQTKKNYSRRVPGLTYTVQNVTPDIVKLVWGVDPSRLVAADLGRGSRDGHHKKVLEWIRSYCERYHCTFVTEGNLQQSGLPGTRGNPDYCRGLLCQLGNAGKGTIAQANRKSLRFTPNNPEPKSEDVPNESKDSSKANKSKNPKTVPGGGG
jgi:hypothetical protein